MSFTGTSKNRFIRECFFVVSLYGFFCSIVQNEETSGFLRLWKGCCGEDFDPLLLPQHFSNFTAADSNSWIDTRFSSGIWSYSGLATEEVKTVGKEEQQHYRETTASNLNATVKNSLKIHIKSSD